MRAPEILLLRWLLLHVSRAIRPTARRLAQFTERFLQTRRSLTIGRLLTALTLASLALCQTLAEWNKRLRDYWESGL